MALLCRSEIEAALTRLGELAAKNDTLLEFVAVGGAAMVLGFNARLATHDIDAVVLPPTDVGLVRRLSKIVADEFYWPIDWMNDGARGYLIGDVRGKLIFESVGIRVYRPQIEQLLAMKLCAWRDDVDISDASLLLGMLRANCDRNEIWRMLETHLLPGRELKAKLAFEDLWESES